MSKARQHLGLKSRPNEPKTYAITITEEQVAFIRGLVLRVDMIWIRHEISRLVDDTGNVKIASVYECYFCNRGSWESASAIVHEKDCVVALVEKEFNGLNTQFLEAEQPTEAE